MSCESPLGRRTLRRSGRRLEKEVGSASRAGRLSHNAGSAAGFCRAEGQVAALRTPTCLRFQSESHAAWSPSGSNGGFSVNAFGSCEAEKIFWLFEDA